MNRFKSIMMENHTKGKANLHFLYTDRQVYNSSVSSSQQEIEDERVYHYRELSFQFAGTDHRTPESLVLFVYVPQQRFACGISPVPFAVAYEDFLLRLLSRSVNQLSEGYCNTHKSVREKPQFSMQTVHAAIQRRNGCIYMEDKRAFRLRIPMQMPLINGVWLNGKSGFKAVKAALSLIDDEMEGINRNTLQTHVRVYARQLELRQLLKEKNLAAFIANGSILPRKNGGDEPMEDAKPFISPKELEVCMELTDGTILTGMGLQKGVTVITGGGYSGKSTLLGSLEMGIYNHIEGDGREYVITDGTACKIYAEDGRCVSHTDISPFFLASVLCPVEQGKGGKCLGEGDGTKEENTCSWHGVSMHDFSTPQASGSLSQAAGIVEAVYGGSRLLLIDEDTSATNFMIRDANMRRLVKREPIIPFTDRVAELSRRGISSVLVIGGSSEYLKYADRVLLMEGYECKDRTKEARELLSPSLEADRGMESCSCNRSVWMGKKYLHIKTREEDMISSRHVEIWPDRCIRLGSCIASIEKLTALISDGQMSSLAYLLERLLTDKEHGEADLQERCERAINGLFAQTMDTVLPYTHKYEFWLEEIRPVDLLMAACRLREDEN